MHNRSCNWCSKIGLGSRRVWLLVFMSLVAAWTAMPLVAQQPPNAASNPTAVSPVNNQAAAELPTLGDLIAQSPAINGIILSMSVISGAMFLYFMLTIQSRSLAPPTFVDDVTKLVINRQYPQATDLCRNHRHVFIASIIQRCVENAEKGHSVILEMLNSEGKRRADILWNRISYLADIANVAPMLGLLGTVKGMINAFFFLPNQSASINSKILSRGIGEAMSTTMFGLMVAILTLVLYSITKARITRTLAEVEQVAHSVSDHIKRGDQ